MATNWTNTEARNYVLYLRGRIQTNLGAVMSETQEDLIVYDTEYYRDEIDAAFMGTARSLIVNQGANGFIVSNGEQTVNPTILSGALTYATPSDPHLEESDSFNHVPPNPLAKTRSRLYWWSGAPDASNVVGAAWADQVICLSPSEYTSGF